MTTIREVADHADVSVATVSRVINNVGYVSEDLRSRVNEAMRALNYQPNTLARSLRRQETRTIGLLIPQVDQPFFSALAFAIEKALFAEDYRLLLCSAQEDHAKETAYAEILVRQRVDGLIVVPTGQSPEIFDLFRQRNVPIVLVDRDMPAVSGSRVLVDNRQGGYAGMAHLLALGHRNIRVIGGPAYSGAMQQRMTGARQALRDYGLPDNGELMTTSNQQYEMGYENAFRLLQETPRPSAIFALTDVTAVGVMHAAARLGLRLPQDLSVVGFDDIPLAGYMIPSLTTVAQPIYPMGEHAARIMLNHLQTEVSTPDTVTLATELIVRDSAVPFAGGQ
jgi:LacI family transcriptional regulator